ncbi:FAD/NAD P-binding domain-containing protein [Gloeophyllum trabeum ATCC 11539]|uniref:FAD/NAD P-binding domain-containing protein n=1 Tax=Gloeophyllum trabeum (strain ATCC 11539 / FP-39264 / Madison 617) TaxID=670483 RepID=S7RA92_GLOTA|nr:FAD/NAD P-binding domain-containing protein [Gloeophyllum trabeum ATCC 11539]EPQ51185.1 FAD/NAD P-binding domain-containing protein [Gloeophyllum trabeum ATCC 11539]
MGSHERVALPLQFIIVGGGIGGLACAYALQKVGHQVVVLEQSDGQFQSKRGIRCPPNMTRPLYEWGLGPALESAAVKASGISFIVGETGEKIGMTVFHEEIMKAFRADFLFVQHGDIHAMLQDLALSTGVEIQYNATVVDIDPYGGVPPLTIGRARSPAVTGDVILGTDGRDSLVRKTVVGHGVREGGLRSFFYLSTMVLFSWFYHARGLLREFEADEGELQWTIWMGDGYGVYGYLTDDKKTYSLVMIWPESPKDKLSAESASWHKEHPVEDIDWDSRGMEVRLRKLINLAKTFTCAQDSVREPIDSWMHESGRVVLAGDAAHPLLPTGSHHVAMAIEDAVTLAHLLSHAILPSNIPLLLTTYEELRQLRTHLVQVSESRKRAFASFPHGPEQATRDRGLREAMREALLDWKHADEDYLREEWKEYVELFNYDAREAVEDWWTKWGALVRRGLRYSLSNGTGTSGSAFSDGDVDTSGEWDFPEVGVKSPQVSVSISSISADGSEIVQCVV